MSRDKNVEVDKVIKSDNNLKETFNKEITSNTSDTTGDIPEFTSGEGDSSGESESDE